MELRQVKIAVTLDDQTLSVMSFLTVGRGNALPHGATWIDQEGGVWGREPTDENIFAELIRAFPEKDLEGAARPTVVKYRVLADGDVPTDRTYRPAWKDAGTAIVHDMDVARTLHLARVRAARSPRLDQLDRDLARATDLGDAKAAAAIRQKKQALRDLPATLAVDKASTVEELKALWSPLLEG